jgi:hypothetical protein
MYSEINANEPNEKSVAKNKNGNGPRLRISAKAEQNAAAQMVG